MAFHVSLPISELAVTTTFSLLSSRWHMIHRHEHSLLLSPLMSIQTHLLEACTNIWACARVPKWSTALHTAVQHMALQIKAHSHSVPLSLTHWICPYLINLCQEPSVQYTRVHPHSYTQNFLTLCPAISPLICFVKWTRKMFRKSGWLHNSLITLLYLLYGHKEIPLCQRSRKLQRSLRHTWPVRWPTIMLCWHSMCRRAASPRSSLRYTNAHMKQSCREVLYFTDLLF